MKQKLYKGWALWFTGLPGSGKSSIARAVVEALRKSGLDVLHLEMDERRKHYFPEPKYTAEERAEAYALFTEEAAELVQQGKGVVMDGVAPARAMRQYAAEMIEEFAEITVRCSVETAMAREAGRPEGKVMAGLYAKALERKRSGKEFPGLGLVPGVDVPFEENPEAAFVLENEALSRHEAVEKTLSFVRGWLSAKDDYTAAS
jgi:adenylylsulfate kinase